MKSTIKTLFSSQFAFFMAVPAVAWQILFFYIPVGLIFLMSFLKGQSWNYSLSFFTLEHYSYFLKPLFFKVIGRSLVLAFVTAFLCLIFAYPVAYCLAIKIKRFKNLFLFFLILPFWTSLMVQIYSWFFILEHNGLLNTIFLRMGLISQPIYMLNSTFAIYVVMVYCYLPFMIMPLYTVLEKLDRRMLEAASDLGATQWQTFRQITIPLSMPGIKTGFFLVFVPSFGEFAVPILMGGGKKLYVGSLITQYFLFVRDSNRGAAFTILSCLLLLVCVIIMYGYFKRKLPLPVSIKEENGTV